MSDVFISYANEDRERAQALARILEGRGWSVFWDRTIQQGKIFAQVIEEALSSASCVLVLWSANSVASEWVRVEAEEGRARRILIPAILDQVRIPLGFRVIQSADLTDWKGDANHPEIQRIVQAIQSLVPLSQARTTSQTLDTGNIFVSYAREDHEYVGKLISYLGSFGLSIWADNRVDYGELWWRTIVANIRRCLAMVVVMTPASEESKWVEREILLADELEKPIFPLLLEGVRFPLFIGTQYHNVCDRSMPPATFINALKRLLER